MKVVVETPKWSLSKYHHMGGVFEVEYKTPFPCLFNYGYVKHTVGDDGSPMDAVVLGNRVSQGTEVEAVEAGTVHFIDDGLVDDKTVVSSDGRVGLLDIIKIHVFFTAYMVFKTIHYYLDEDRLARCRYLGFTRAL